jgi:hypothetical protein
MEFVVERKRLWLVEAVVVCRQQWHCGVVDGLRKNITIFIVIRDVVVDREEFLLEFC